VFVIKTFQHINEGILTPGKIHSMVSISAIEIVGPIFLTNIMAYEHYKEIEEDFLSFY
jgi:hypothetical protein